MVISFNSQLGLRFKEPEVKIHFLTLMKDYFENEIGLTQESIQNVADIMNKLDQGEGVTKEMIEWYEKEQGFIPQLQNEKSTREKVSEAIGTSTVLVDDEGSSYYFICDSVYKCAELIKIGENFSGRTLKDINLGKYTYLMGKNRMVRFACAIGAIRGFYYDDKENKAFDFGIEMENGDYFFEKKYAQEFSTIMQVLTFVELGDIEVVMLPEGRNNGGKKNTDKITNTSNKTVYVVDSSWNKLIIRTEGFAVRGHFRLQPCGEGMKDRKMIWIDAFEKHGYHRRPTAEIVR